MRNRIWMRWKSFGRFLGNLLARIILTIFYFTVFVPFGSIVTLLGDWMHTKSVPDEFWQFRESSIDTLESVRRQA